MKISVKFMIFFAAVLALIIIIELFRPQPINWRATYSKEDKIPYGNYALFTLLPSIFPHSKIHTSEQPISNYLKNRKLNNSSYVIVAETVDFDSLDLAALLHFVGEGNVAFIAAENFEYKLCDTLQVGTNFNFIKEIQLFLIDSTIFVPHKQFKYKTNRLTTYFESVDTEHSIVLGKNHFGNPTFIRVTFGKGQFYLCSTPTAFTNYYLLERETSRYITDVFTYIPDGIIIWDEYYNGGNKYAQSSLRFVLAHEPLRYAWYVLLVWALFFILFRVKRRQRAIPIIETPKNTSLEFVETVGRLYFERKNNKNIAEKRIAYLLEYIRTKLSLPIIELNDKAINIVAEKFAIGHSDIQSLFAAIGHVRNSEQISDELLTDINSKIESFYKSIRHR